MNRIQANMSAEYQRLLATCDPRRSRTLRIGDRVLILEGHANEAVVGCAGVIEELCGTQVASVVVSDMLAPMPRVNEVTQRWLVRLDDGSTHERVKGCQLGVLNSRQMQPTEAQ